MLLKKYSIGNMNENSGPSPWDAKSHNRRFKNEDKGVSIDKNELEIPNRTFREFRPDEIFIYVDDKTFGYEM
jgi:hypothetical protein